MCLSVIFVSRQEKLAVLSPAKQLTSTLKSVRNAASCTYGRRRDATFPSCSCSSRVMRFSRIPSQIFLWSLLWFLPAPWFVSVHLYHLKKKKKSHTFTNTILRLNLDQWIAEELLRVREKSHSLLNCPYFKQTLICSQTTLHFLTCAAALRLEPLAKFLLQLVGINNRGETRQLHAVWLQRTSCC